jgi:peptide/nickel transport system permease protein
VSRFLIRRLLFVVLSFFGATVLIFILSRMSVDPRELFVPEGGYGMTRAQWEEMGRQMGFDKPVVVQYFLWVGRLVRGDWGKSLSQGQLRVRPILAGRIGATMQLALGAWLFAVLVGVPIGILAAVKRATILDYAGRLFAIVGLAAPAFWVGIMLILIFAVKLKWFPVGMRSEDIQVKDYVLPSITLGWAAAAGIMRLTRSAMLEILDSEYIKFARAKGVKEWAVIWKHAFKNSLIPPLTSALIILSHFLTGSVVVETVFAWPGMGQVVIGRAVPYNDFPLLLGAVFIYVALFLFFSLLADLAYAYIDPRIRFD